MQHLKKAAGAGSTLSIEGTLGRTEPIDCKTSKPSQKECGEGKMYTQFKFIKKC